MKQNYYCIQTLKIKRKVNETNWFESQQLKYTFIFIPVAKGVSFWTILLTASDTRRNQFDYEGSNCIFTYPHLFQATKKRNKYK